MLFVHCFNNSFICLNCFIYHHARVEESTACRSHFFHHEGSGDGTQVINLGGNYLYWLSHLDGLFVLVLVVGLVFEMGYCYVA